LTIKHVDASLWRSKGQMREKQLKEFLPGKVNSILESAFSTHSINEIVSKLWETSGNSSHVRLSIFFVISVIPVTQLLKRSS